MSAYDCYWCGRLYGHDEDCPNDGLNKVAGCPHDPCYAGENGKCGYCFWEREDSNDQMQTV